MDIIQPSLNNENNLSSDIAGLDMKTSRQEDWNSIASIFDSMKSYPSLHFHRYSCILVSVFTPPISEKLPPASKISPPRDTSWYARWWVFTASFDIAIPDYISACEPRCESNDDWPPFKAQSDSDHICNRFVIKEMVFNKLRNAPLLGRCCFASNPL